MKKIIVFITIAVILLSSSSALADIFASIQEGTVAINATNDCRIMIAKGAEKHYFDVNSGETILPLPYGDGKYSVVEYKHVSGNVYHKEKTISLRYTGDEDAAFLQPSAVVNYDDDSLAVAKAAELCQGVTDVKAKAKIIYNWVGTQFIYDYIGAIAIKANKTSRYSVNIDEVFTNRTGVCYDLSVMLAAMLRSQGVAAKVQIGHGHAWLSVKTNKGFAVMDITAKLQLGKSKNPNFNYDAEEVF